MRHSTSKTSLFGLFGELRDEIKTLIKQEVELAKTEMSEKVSRLGRSAVGLAIGGFTAYGGVLLLLASIGSLLAFGFESMGLQRTLAECLGFGIIAITAGLIGYAFIAKALRALSGESLAPEKTLHTLRELKGDEVESTMEEIEPAPEPKRSSEEVQASVETTQYEMTETMEEISHRLTPRYMGQTIARQIKAHPVRSSLIGAGTGLAGFFAIRSRIRNHRS